MGDKSRQPFTMAEDDKYRPQDEVEGGDEEEEVDGFVRGTVGFDGQLRLIFFAGL